MASRKAAFALAVRSAVTALAEAAERVAVLDGVYKDSGYDPGGADPIIEADLVGQECMVQDLTNASTFAANLVLFLNAGDPIVFDFASAINKFRNMS